MAKQSRPSGKRTKKPSVGTGGHGRQALEGRGPTPKAEDRPYHPKAKAKARSAAQSDRRSDRSQRDEGTDRFDRTDGPKRTERSERGGRPDRRPAERQQSRTARQPKRSAGDEYIGGRNTVFEALTARVPAKTLYVATRIEVDDRVKSSLALASSRGIPILEVTRPDLDRFVGEGSVHQGMVLQVPAYQYKSPDAVLDGILASGAVPLIVALDGITDPRNLGAILRSVGAFGGQAVVVPARRSAGVTAAAWKTSAGAALRVPVALAPNLTQTLKDFKHRGLFVVGLDGAGDVSLPDLQLATDPLVIVVGSEGKGLSRLVKETCDAVVSIPIERSTESLNAGIAVAVALYGVSQRRTSDL